MLTKQQIAEAEAVVDSGCVADQPQHVSHTLVILISPQAQLHFRAIAQAAEIDAELQAIRTLRLLRRLRDAEAAARVIDIDANVVAEQPRHSHF